MIDNVKHPKHYRFAGFEVIALIREVLGEEGFKKYCVGNAIKYIFRHERKGRPEEDLRKAIQYLEWAVDAYKPVPAEEFDPAHLFGEEGGGRD